MRVNKKVIESAVVVSMVTALSITAVTNDTAIAGKTKEETQVALDSTQGSVAGVSGVLNSYEISAYGEQKNRVTVQKELLDMVTSSLEEEKPEEAKPEEQQEEIVPVLSPEELEWQNYLMADVSEALNVRAEGNGEADVIGKLHKGDRASILETGAEWTKITSGNVTGYVKNEYCLTGSAALSYAKENCDTVAKATVDNLRVRRSASTEADVIETLEAGETIKVDTSAAVEPGWVAVKYDSETCYVSAEYVEVYLKTGTAITVEEEAELERERQEAEEAKRREEAAKKSQGTEIKQGTSLAATVDERTLLATIIYCEAGGSTYECQLGVGAVVINRVKSGYFPNNIYDVIHQSGQWGPVATGKLERWLSRGVSSTAYEAADAALAGQDNTGGALYCNDYWKHSGLVIGEMVFY